MWAFLSLRTIPDAERSDSDHDPKKKGGCCGCGGCCVPRSVGAVLQVESTALKGWVGGLQVFSYTCFSGISNVSGRGVRGPSSSLAAPSPGRERRGAKRPHDRIARLFPRLVLNSEGWLEGYFSCFWFRSRMVILVGDFWSVAPLLLRPNATVSGFYTPPWASACGRLMGKSEHGTGNRRIF